MIVSHADRLSNDGVAMTGVGTANTGKAAWRGTVTGTLTLLAVILFGEAGIVFVTGIARHVAGGANAMAWAFATTLNALLAYVLVGLPQVRAWEAAGADAGTGAVAPDGTRDPRARIAARTLSGGGLAAFVLASIIGGPLAVGWFYGRRRDPRARSLTWTSAWLLAAVWSAVYLGLLAWVL